jgi:type IV pilus assembly protein PilV
MKNLTKHKQSGVGIVEVIVAILVLSAGVIGAIGLQLATAKEQRSSQFLSRAGLLAIEMAERMRSNRDAMENLPKPSSDPVMYLTNLDFNVKTAIANTLSAKTTTPSPACNATNVCNRSQIANYDIIQWRQSILTQMPPDSAGMLLMPTGASEAMLARDIVIVWREPVVQKNSAGTPVLLSAGLSGCPTALHSTLPAGMRCYVQRVML